MFLIFNKSNFKILNGLLMLLIFACEKCSSTIVNTCEDCRPASWCPGTNNLVGTELQIALNESNCARNDWVCCSHTSGYVKLQKPTLPEIDNDLATSLHGHPNARLLPEICGNASTFETLPWRAEIFYNMSGIKIYLCSGSIINSRHIVTSSKCVDEYDKDLFRNGTIFYTRIGGYERVKNNLTSSSEGYPLAEGSYQEIDIEEIIVHPTAKIILFRLKSLIDLISRDTRPVCLPLKPRKLISEEGFPSWLYDGQRLWNSDGCGPNKLVAGWFSSDDLYDVVRHKVVCAGQRGLITCTNYSNKPLFMKESLDNKEDEYKYFLYGIAGSVSYSCDNSITVPFTDITMYMQWILDNINGTAGILERD